MRGRCDERHNAALGLQLDAPAPPQPTRHGPAAVSYTHLDVYKRQSMRIEVVPGALNVLQPLDIGHAEPIATAEAPKRPESSLSGRQ